MPDDAAEAVTLRPVLAIALLALPLAAGGHPEALLHVTPDPYVVDLAGPGSVARAAVLVANGHHDGRVVDLALRDVPAGWDLRLGASRVELPADGEVAVALHVAAPPEAAPGETASFRVAYASADGSEAGSAAGWARIGVPQDPVATDDDVVGTRGVLNAEVAARCGPSDVDRSSPGAVCRSVPVADAPFACTVASEGLHRPDARVVFASFDGARVEARAFRDGEVEGHVPAWARFVGVEVAGAVLRSTVACTYRPPPVFPDVG